VSLQIPEFIDFADAENEATALGRGLSIATRGWGELLAVAQAVMMHFQDIPDLEASEFASLTDYKVVAPLVGAARIFDTMAKFAPELTAKDRSDLNWQAVVAYAMYGKFSVRGRCHERAKPSCPRLPCNRLSVASLVRRQATSSRRTPNTASPRRMDSAAATDGHLVSSFHQCSCVPACNVFTAKDRDLHL
jgi:hypothetical protein